MNNWKFGEKELLRKLHLKLGDSSLKWRDDCIETAITPELSLVYSIDSTERRLSHNNQDDSRVFGKWVASIILSDIIACGVAPKGLSLDVGIGAFHDEDDLFLFFDGILDVCTHYCVNYEGGNINRSNLVGGVAWGAQAPDKIIHREGAQDNSILIATAPIGLGWAYELYQRLDVFRTKQIPQALLKEVQEYKSTSVINLDAFQEIWDLGVIDCGMDLTDGIIEFGYEIHDRTGLGVVFMPTDPHPFVRFVAACIGILPESIMFDPGFDTPLSHGWCIKEENVDKVLNVLRKHGVPYTVLGKVTSQVAGVFRKTRSGNIPLPRYWDDKLNNNDIYELWKKRIIDIDFSRNGEQLNGKSTGRTNSIIG